MNLSASRMMRLTSLRLMDGAGMGSSSVGLAKMPHAQALRQRLARRLLALARREGELGGPARDQRQRVVGEIAGNIDIGSHKEGGLVGSERQHRAIVAAGPAGFDPRLRWVVLLIGLGKEIVLA